MTGYPSASDRNPASFRRRPDDPGARRVQSEPPHHKQPRDMCAPHPPGTGGDIAVVFDELDGQKFSEIVTSCNPTRRYAA